MESSVLCGDSLTVLRTLPEEHAATCVTSPPYYQLRDYGVSGQLGLESSSEEYIRKLVAVFREVRRVLKRDGTLWLNLGDTYNAYNGNRGPSKGANRRHHEIMPSLPSGHGLTDKTLKAKDLIGIPWRVALALQVDGWYLRSDVVWYKPNPLPERVKDRPHRSHEYVFLLTKSDRYSYHAPARHDVWTVSLVRSKFAHDATFPEELAELCVSAGSRVGDVVLDPFCGSGTTLRVAERMGRRTIGIDLNPQYCEMARNSTP